jgi:HEAT repeat protein
MSDVPQLRIRNAQELLAALEDPDLGVRMAVLQVVARHPERALAYGCHDGRDVVHVLLEQSAGRERRGLWEVVVATLAVFRDPRVVGFFERLLASARRAETMFTAASRLEHEPIDSLREFLRPLLMQNDSDARARAAARLLIRASGLDVAAQIRAALLAGAGRVQPPLLTDDTVGCWMAELAGLFGPLARNALEAQGGPALHVLATRWEHLAERERMWLLQWAAAASPDAATPLIERALASGSTELVLAALENLPALGDRAEALAPALVSLAHGSDPTLRLAAVEAGARGLDFRAMLATEQSPALRRACLSALARADGDAALPELVAALHDHDWSVRAAAARALESLGDGIAPAVEPLAHDADPRIRTAAVQILVRLGRDAWLEENLLA